MAGIADSSKPLRRVTLTVDPDDYAAMENLARASRISTSWLVRRSMREFLERHDTKNLSGVVTLGFGRVQGQS